MKKLRLRYLGDPVLRRKARHIDKVTPVTRETVAAMWDLMYDADGIGLAAPQVGLSQRIIIIDTREPGEKVTLINPEIVWKGEAMAKCKEGCLSIPGVEGEVIRALKVRVKGLGIDGKPVEISASGLYARAFQHEIDHLNGIVFVDQVSPEELERLQPQLEEFEPCAVV